MEIALPLNVGPEPTPEPALEPEPEAKPFGGWTPEEWRAMAADAKAQDLCGPDARAEDLIALPGVDGKPVMVDSGRVAVVHQQKGDPAWCKIEVGRTQGKRNVVRRIALPAMEVFRLLLANCRRLRNGDGLGTVTP